MSAFYDLGKTPRNILNQAIVRAIVSENNGLLFDPSDMTTLYQDAAGTIPVTAVEQPVGKILDKSGNGNHATQSVTASRPVLSARYNLGLNTSQVMPGYNGWGGGAVGTINSALAPDGTMTASTVTAQEWMWREGFGGTYGSCIFAICARAPSGTSFQTSIIIQNAGSDTKIAYKVITVTDVWQRFIVSGITTSGASLCRVTISSAAGGINPPVGSMWWGYDVRVGADIGPYQRVNTATDYDTNPLFFPKYLRFDGVDDYLNLPYVGLYAGGEMSIIAARNAVSQSTDTYIISERSTTDADPKYFPSRQLANGGNMDAYISDDAGAVVLDTVGSAFGGAADKVIRSVVDTGRNIKLYKNGALAADDNYTRAGTLTLNNTTLGASVSTTTGNYASMKLYGLIITKKALSPAQRIKCERYAASKVGVIL